jgi:hypothetical protein
MLREKREENDFYVGKKKEQARDRYKSILGVNQIRPGTQTSRLLFDTVKKTYSRHNIVSLVFRIRIRIVSEFNQVSGSRRAKITPKIGKS